MLSGGMKCVKYLLFGFNFIIALAGLVLIIIGALLQTKFKDYLEFFDGRTNAAAIFLIVIGIVVAVIGFFGCCGAIKENHCMIITFVVFLCIILVLEIAAAITVFVLRNKVTRVAETQMKKATKNYNITGHHGVTMAWDKLQKQFKCCGAENYTDWNDNEKLRNTSSVPDSCCKNPTSGCGLGQLENPRTIYTDGCVNGFIIWVTENIHVVGGIAAALTVVEIIGIIIAGCLASAIRRDYEPV